MSVAYCVLRVACCVLHIAAYVSHIKRSKRGCEKEGWMFLKKKRVYFQAIRIAYRQIKRRSVRNSASAWLTCIVY